MRVRHEIEQAIHDFFYARGFIHVDTPILTGAIGERSGLFSTEYFDDIVRENQPRYSSAQMIVNMVQRSIWHFALHSVYGRWRFEVVHREPPFAAPEYNSEKNSRRLSRLRDGR